MSKRGNAGVSRSVFDATSTFAISVVTDNVRLTHPGLNRRQRKLFEEEDAWMCACREVDEETGGYAANFLRGTAPPAHVTWLGIERSEQSKWVGGKVVYMYETADHLLAEDWLVFATGIFAVITYCDGPKTKGSGLIWRPRCFLLPTRDAL
jgi:hypothetical protein